MFVFSAMLCMPVLAAVDSKLVEQAEKYLNSITGLDGTFVQTANGKKEKPKFLSVFLHYKY